MSHSIMFIVIVLAIVFGAVVVQYYHKRHQEYKLEDIEKAVRSAYPKGVGSIRKDKLVVAIKTHFHCSSKEAHYIIGVARRKKLIDIDSDFVSVID